MNDLSQKLQKGVLLIIEDGEYSDRSWSGPVRMLKTFTKQQLADDFRAEWKATDFESWRDKPNPNDFLPWLIKTGRAEHVENVENWHVGSYGDFEP